MSFNRPRAKSHTFSLSTSSSSTHLRSEVVQKIPTSIVEGAEESNTSLPQIIKVPHRKSLTKSHKLRINPEEESNDSTESLGMTESESALEDESLSLTPKEASKDKAKFGLFPRKKQSPRNLQTSPSLIKSQGSSPRSTNSSPRGSPRSGFIKTSRSNSPRLDLSEEILGELPFGKKAAAQVMEDARKKLEEIKREQEELRKKQEEHRRKQEEFSEKPPKFMGLRFKLDYLEDYYDIVITSSDLFGMGSHFYLIDRNNMLGKGGFSEVCAAFNLQTGEKCAAKIYSAAAGFSMAFAEKNCLEGLGRFKGAINLDLLSTGGRIIFTDYFSGRPLLKEIYKYLSPDAEHGRPEILYKEKINHPYHIRLSLVIKILQEMADFHEAGFINRDIKTDNFLCQLTDSVISLKLIDFDTAFPKSKTITKIASTFGYLAPEITKDIPEPYSIASDLFSTGIVIWEVLSNANFQENLSKKFEEILDKEKGKRHLNRAELVDMFAESSESVVEPRTKEEAIDGFVYQYFIKKQLMVLISQLTAEDPAVRLKGSSLREEVENVIQLTNKFDNIVNSITLFIDGLSNIQVLGLPLKLCVDMVKNHASLNPKMIWDIIQAIPDNSKRKSNPAEVIDDFQVLFSSLFQALNNLKMGADGLANSDVSFRAIEPLVKKFALNPRDCADFFNFLAVQPLTPQIDKAIVENGTKK